MKSVSERPELRDYLQVLKKRWRVIFVVFGGVFGLVLLGTFLSTPLYEGTSKVIIERVESETLSTKSRYQPEDPSFEKTQFQLIKSNAVAKKVVEILGLETIEEAKKQSGAKSWFGPVTAIIKSTLSSFSSQEESSEDDKPRLSPVESAASTLSENVEIRPVKGSDISAISYISPDPAFSALIANTYVDAYLQEVLEMKMDATRRNLEWMTHKAEGERLKLQTAEKSLQTYMEQNNLITLEDRITIIPEKLGQLGLDLVKAEAKTKEHKRLYDKVQALGDNLSAAETVLSISEGSSLEVIRAQILKAEQSNMELSNKYGSKHPTMIKANNDLQVLKRKQREEIRRLISKVKNQYELALSNELSIKEQLNLTKTEALDLNEKYNHYSVLKRDLETNRQMYDALLGKIKTQSITGETRPVNVWVVEKAKASKSPVKPMVTVNLSLGLIVGLFGGIWMAFLFHKFDNRIKSSDGLGEALGVAVLGSITYNKNSESMGDIARTDPRSEFAESYNALRTTLLLSAAEAPPKRILVTSSIAGEGKTTTSVNLALTMAKSDSRVILIDADLRKPVVHKIFKLNNKTGLSSYLAGSADKSILKKTSLENLVVIPAGPPPPNPYELLNSQRMKALLLSLENEFDVIICDSPPILSVADSRLLSQNMNGLIMVARAGKSTYPMVRNSIQLLRDVNATILGVLVNAVLAKDQDYYEYYSSYIEDAAKSQKTT